MAPGRHPAASPLAVVAALLLVTASSCAAQEGPQQPTEAEANAFVQRALAAPEDAFSEWAVACGKTYANKRVQDRAFRIWSKRLAAVAAANADPARTSYSSVNCISDRPVPPPLFGKQPADGNARAAPGAVAPEAVKGRAYTTGFRRPTGTNAVVTSRLRNSGFNDGTQCPPELDWRQIGGVTGIKDQGSCGACWAFAASGAIETAFYSATGTLPDLSVSQIVDCDTQGANAGCGGGFPSGAFQHIISVGGIMPTSSYAYTPSQKACAFDASRVAVQLKGYTDIAAGDESALLQAVCNQPVTIALEANNAFMSYTGGVFSAACAGTNLNHAVLVVGYGVDAATNTNFWLVKNSWGIGWGETGYMKIRRGTNQCGLVNYPPSYPTVSGAPDPGPGPTPPPDPQPPPPDSGCPPSYTVKSGDSLFVIAGRYKINYLTLLAANPSIFNPDLIFVGQTITLPCPPKIQCKAAVSVQPGDTIWQIGVQNGVTLQDMLVANPQFVNPNMIYPGDVVYVPPCTQTPETVAAGQVKPGRNSCRPTDYTAKKGDFPGRVAANFNMQLGDLYKLNPQLRRFATRFITPGQILKVLSCPKAVRLAYTAPQVCKSTYTVVAGDTPAAVARKAATTISKLMQYNKWIVASNQALPAKRKLCIPP